MLSWNMEQEIWYDGEKRISRKDTVIEETSGRDKMIKERMSEQ